MTNTPHERPKSVSLSRYALAMIPLVVFGGIAATATKILYDQKFHGRNISEIPSALIGTKAPLLKLPPLEGYNVPALTHEAINGKLTLVNVFASWCVPCRDEHPLLKQLAADGRLNIVAINYKDTKENAVRFREELGNPYHAIASTRTARQQSTGGSTVFRKAISSGLTAPSSISVSAPSTI